MTQTLTGDALYKLGALLIGKVTPVARYARDEIVRAGGVTQHPLIVVGLNTEGIELLAVFSYFITDMPRVGDVAEAHTLLALKDKANRL